MKTRLKSPAAVEAAFPLQNIVKDIHRLTAQIEKAEMRSNASIHPLLGKLSVPSRRRATPKPQSGSDTRQVEQAMVAISARLDELEKSMAAPRRQGLLFGLLDQSR